jgi:hypothetical protein
MLQPLHGADTEASEFGSLKHACALGELTSSGFKLLGVSVGASEAQALLASLADEVTVSFDGVSGTG